VRRVVAFALLLLCAAAPAAAQQNRFAVIVQGASGDPEFATLHRGWVDAMTFGLGAGVKYFRWESIGLRAHFRYKPTMLNDEDAADFCDPFGFCQGTLSQIEFAGGAVVRF
jgi:hypothetical protein